MARNEQLPSLVDGIQKGANGGDQVVDPVPGGFFRSGNGPLGLLDVVQPEVGSILGVHLLAGALGIRPLVHLRLVPVPADQGVFGPGFHAAVGSLLAEYRGLQAGTKVEETVDDQPGVVLLRSQRFQRGTPGNHLLHFRFGKEPQYGKMLAPSARDLAAETVDRSSLESAPFPPVQLAAGLLNVPLGPLQVAAGKNHAPLLAGLHHGVGVRQAGRDGFVGGDPFDSSLGAGDDRILHELGGSDNGGDVGHRLLQHGGRILVERLDSETLADHLAPLRVPLGDGHQLGVGHGAIDFRIILTHPPATDNGHPVLFLAAGSLAGARQPLGGRASQSGGRQRQRGRLQKEVSSIHGLSPLGLLPAGRHLR